MAMAPHLLNGIVYCLGNGLFFARQEDIDKPRVFWYSIKRPLGPCWCGAMAAQLICNQWVAGSTPVTSSKKDPAIYRQNGGVYRGIFAFLCVANPSECALFVPYCSKNALSECLTECLVLDARRGGFVPVYRLFDSKKACPVCSRAGSCAIWGFSTLLGCSVHPVSLLCQAVQLVTCQWLR